VQFVSVLAHKERVNVAQRNVDVNACLTCPDFQTTVEFLLVHRDEAEETEKMAEAAEPAGYSRLAANHRRVLENLGKVISPLEAIEADGRAGA